ncbi:MAG: helix-turn-helix transcriptional regulator [Actinomycetota bacterium]
MNAPDQGDRPDDGAVDEPAGLSARELEVLRLVAEAHTNAEIAFALNISVRTAQAHVASAMSKLGARSRTHLAVIALRRGLAPLDPPDGD